MYTCKLSKNEPNKKKEAPLGGANIKKNVKSISFHYILTIFLSLLIFACLSFE